MTESVPTPASSPNPTSPLKRRGVRLGAAAAAGAAAVATKLAGGSAVEAGVAAVPAKSTEGAAGYRLTEHVKRYYESTRA